MLKQAFHSSLPLRAVPTAAGTRPGAGLTALNRGSYPLRAHHPELTNCKQGQVMTVITVFEKPGAVWRANENKFLETLRQAGPLVSVNRKGESASDIMWCSG